MSKVCMNVLCGAQSTPQWKRGWPMKSGGFATLCYSCGNAYDHVKYCERFHLNEPGWRECKFCEKPIHCGCVVSKYLHECLDLGGISCLKCIRARGTQALKPMQNYHSDSPNGFLPFSGPWHPSSMSNRVNGGASVDKGNLTQLNEAIEKHQSSPLTPSIGLQIKQDENRFSSSKDTGKMFSSASTLFATPDNGLKALYETMPQPSINYNLGNAIATAKSPVTPNNPNGVLPNPNGAVDGKDSEKAPPFKQAQRSRLTFTKPSKSGANKGTVSDNRVARPPAEGKGRSQLLPRYWPKMTDQELLQISGDLKSDCTITPLFEKILSASDAGRIGRLVLPKACAEAYFPTINSSEGLPIRIQDVKGKEWTFQFRFWPNNNSRMYVLEGVTPCIQNLDLQAGDTVIFSRLNPGEKLVVGCRKAAVAADAQEGNTPAANGVAGGTSGGNGNLSGKKMEHEGTANGVTPQKPMMQEKKKTRNIGPKNKRLLMHNEDAMELKVTWEEAHELLRPSPSSKPTISTIEDCEFEEYDEPPVFGKRTIFSVDASGSQEQWGQCDNCSRWRRLPADALLPPKWTCADNVWDPDRCSCSAPDEISTKDLERIFKTGKDFKKRKLTEAKVAQEQAPCGLDALATAAILGEPIGGELGETSSGPTTKHPRHRPGCTCIVCIQPPSGKGKHKPNCFCNVCLTVKRRFKTMMLRKKKRLSDEAAQKSLANGIVISDGNEIEVELGESSGKGGQLDLNCDPDKEEDMLMVDVPVTNVSSIPLEWQNVLEVLVPCSQIKSTTETEGPPTQPPIEETPAPADETVEQKVVEDGQKSL